MLIPTDFSVQADFSYLLVRNLEEHLSVDIHFLHVLDFPDTVTIDGNGNVETCGEIDIDYVKGQKRIAEAKLNQLKVLYGDAVYVSYTHLDVYKRQALKYDSENHILQYAMSSNISGVIGSAVAAGVLISFLS